jgi:hypothetical protein
VGKFPPLERFPPGRESVSSSQANHELETSRFNFTNIDLTPSQTFLFRLVFSSMQMKLTRISRIGLALIGFGLLIFLGFAIWVKSIRTAVLVVPFPMKAEAVSKDFSVDYDAIYTMWVQFDRTVSREGAHCLLGAQKSGLDADLNCKDLMPLLKFSWALGRDGKNGAIGSSSDVGSSSTEDNSLKVSIFSFPAQKKHRYTLTMNFEQDGSSLKIPPPKVRIELDIFNREDFIWAGMAFDSLGLLFCVIGAIMVLVPLLKAKLKQSKLRPNQPNTR